MSQSELHSFAPRARSAHKGDFGVVLVVGGAQGYGGAAILSAEGAMRTGAGRVALATGAESHVVASLSRMPEIMAQCVNSTTELIALIEKATVLVVGPGLGLERWGVEMAREIFKSDLPKVVDADALNLIAMGRLTAPSKAVFTPHPGEAARLLDTSVSEIEKDRRAAVCELQKRLKGIVVLKGANTLVAGDSEIFTCQAGNPGMASAGMGDLLSGIIAALMAQGFSAFEAAKLGVSLHAEAGDLAAADGERGLIASDLLMYLKPLLNR